MGLPCPSCRNPIGLDLGFIIRNPVSRCPHCDVIMEFNVNERISKEYKEVLNEIENIKKEYKGVKFG